MILVGDNDPTLRMISAMIGKTNGNNFAIHEIDEGVYVRPDFGSSNCFPGYDNYPELSKDGVYFGKYGVCDNYKQIIDKCQELNNPERTFIICLTPVRKENQSPDGGWRWHKWGDYIGDKKPKCEYLYDEPEIDLIYCYHIYEKI